MNTPNIDTLLTPDRVLILSEPGITRDGIIHALCNAVSGDWPGVETDELRETVMKREEVLPTRLSPLLALPHAVIPSVTESRMAAAVIPGGVAWDSDTDHPVRLVMLLVGNREDHLPVLSALAERLREGNLPARLAEVRRPEEFLSLFAGDKGATPRRHFGRDLSALVLEEALRLRATLGSARLILHADALGEAGYIERLASGKDVLVVTSRQDLFPAEGREGFRVVVLPFRNERCSPDIHVVFLYLLGVGALRQDDLAVYLSGKPGSGFLDSLRLVAVGDELNLQAPGGLFGDSSAPADLTVFNRVLRLAMELAAEGREGKPVGTIFVVGGEEEVRHHTTQMIANPFTGYDPTDRNILDPGMEETLKEYAKIDGAFIIAADGTIESAGTFLSARPTAGEMRSGLGARHAAAQGITAVSPAVAVVISESTRKVTVFRAGKAVMEL